MARTRRRNGYVEKLNTKTRRWERVSKPQPAKPAVKTNPVTRTGPVKGPVPPKGRSALKLPNSAKAGVNLPKVGAGVERKTTQGPNLKGTQPTPRTAPKPSAASGAGGAGRLLGAAGTALAIPAAIKNIKDVAERNRRWEEYKKKNGMGPQTGISSNARPGTRTGSNPSTASRPSSPSRSQGTRRGAAGGGRTAPAPQSNWRDRVTYTDPNTLRQAPAPAPAPLRSPAVGAPIHSAPKDFGSAYAPQAGQAPRPNTPQPSPAQPQPAANPFSSVGDVRGQQLSPVAANMPNAKPQVGNQEFQGQKLQGIDDNGIDMERRRAFLDADNSLDGMKAIRELLNRRKLSIAVES